MRNRIASVLLATIAGAMFVASAPAHAASDIDADVSYRDPFKIHEQRPLNEEQIPRSLSFKFASLYSRIRDTATWIADSTHVDWNALHSLGLNISFQSIDSDDSGDYVDAETTDRLLPQIEETFSSRLSLRIDVTDDLAPLLDPAPRQPDDPIKDHIWVAVTARYDHSERLSLDIGYEHLWVNETTVNRPGGIGSDVLGDYRSEMDLVGARLRLLFD